MDVVTDNYDAFFNGLFTTVSLALLSAFAAFVLGFCVAFMRLVPVKLLTVLSGTYVEVVRNTPLAVLFVLVFFGLPKVGIAYSSFWTAVLVLSIYTSSHAAEIFRSGSNAVQASQLEAARAHGLTTGQVMRGILFPQAMRATIAPFGSLFIDLVKNTSIAYTISVVELTGTAAQLTTTYATPLVIFAVAAVGYVILTMPAGYVFGVLEEKWGLRQ